SLILHDSSTSAISLYHHRVLLAVVAQHELQ
ncbi:MAG: hypothetical protein ACI8PY_000244, partial [Oceanospirillaceae bacterium]